MKICILGPKKTGETEIELIEEAKNIFEKVLYVPLSNVRIECTGKRPAPYYKDTNLLEFDVFLPRIFKKASDMGYVLMKTLEGGMKYSPINHLSVLFGYNEFLLPMQLRENGIPSLKSYFAMSRSALEKTISDLKYPIVLKLPYDKKGEIIIDSEETAKGVFDAVEELSQPLLVQDFAGKADSIDALVAGKKIFALKNKKLPARLSKIETKTILRASKAINASVSEINCLRTEEGLLVHGANICPNLTKYEPEFGPVSREVLRHLHAAAAVHYEFGVIKFLKWFERGMP
ncbi:MAG: ATP-grasp domain-containing protein [Candidatus Aenigmarchaeota archaeon]|nr:ATP-grasp domain-containing protein [Candidatus Aenigmarchaeota archaeon]